MKSGYLPFPSPRAFQRYRSHLLGCDAVVVCFPSTLRDAVRALQANGTRVLAYASIYKATVALWVERDTGFRNGSVDSPEVLINPFWEATRLLEPLGEASHDTSRSSEGGLLRPFGKSSYKSGWFQACPSGPGRIDRIVDGVQGLMREGLDGVLLDNVIDHSLCAWEACASQARSFGLFRPRRSRPCGKFMGTLLDREANTVPLESAPKSARRLALELRGSRKAMRRSRPAVRRAVPHHAHVTSTTAFVRLSKMALKTSPVASPLTSPTMVAVASST